MTSPAPQPADVEREVDPIDVMYGLRDIAAVAANELAMAVQSAQAKLDQLNRLANFWEDAAQLVAASDLSPTHHARVPDGAGLVRLDVTQ